jgi:RNA polymerase sigma-70 factor, ECF subfamily
LRDSVYELKGEFREWYQSEIQHLFGYVMYWVRQKNIAEDLTATICEKALNQLHQYDPRRGTLNQWIFGIARNHLKMHFRAERFRPRIISLDGDLQVTSREDSPEDLYERQEAFRRVIQLLDRVSPQERDVIALRYGGGLTNPDIARTMAISVNQVAVLMHRGLNKLRGMIHGVDEESSDEK